MVKKATSDPLLALAKKGTRKKGKKGRKIGRSKRHPAAQRYTAERRWEKNKRRRMQRHLRHYPNDSQARRLIESL